MVGIPKSEYKCSLRRQEGARELKTHQEKELSKKKKMKEDEKK